VSRKKTLPDHSSSKVELNSPFSEAIISELKAEFNIPEYYPLQDRLNGVAYWYQWGSNNATPPRSEQKQILATVHEQAAALEETLSKMGHVEGLRLDVATPPERRPHFSLEQTILNISELKHVARRAVECIPLPVGRPTDEVFKSVIQSLRDEYQQATGDNRKITYDTYEEKYTGPAFEFIRRCLPVLGINKLESSIASAIKSSR